MGALAGGLVLSAVLAAIVLAFTWQAWRRRRGDSDVVYVIGEAAAFIHRHLSPPARARLSPAAVRRILEWQLEYQQVEAPRSGGRSVVGSGDAIEYVLRRATEQEMPLEAIDVAEVTAADVEYLLTIGAVGPPAEDPS